MAGENNFAVKYAKVLDQKFKAASQTLRHMRNRGEYKEDGGVASVYFRTVDTSDFLQGHTKATFATPEEVNSDVVRKDVELFYEINKMLTAVQMDDTAGALKEAGSIMQLAIDESYAPLLDKIALGAAINAAKKWATTHVITYDPTNPLKSLGMAQAVLKNQRSFAKTQTLFIAASAEPDFDEKLFTSFTPAKNDDVMSTGELKKLKGISVEIVPDDFFKTMATEGTKPYAQAKFTAAPKIKAVLWDDRVMGSVNKMKDISVLTGDLARAAGADGAVLRGLFRPGAWVFDANGTKKGVVVLEVATTTASTTKE